MRRSLSGVILVILVLILFAPVLTAQSLFANLSGTVTDSTGAVVPEARITIQNAETRVSRQLTANAAGFFSVAQLPTGTYNVIAEAKGFQKWVGSGITLQSSDDKTLNITMKVGAATETVEVSAEAGQIAIVDSGEKTTDISQKELQDLSLAGRNASEFVKILAGASLSANGGLNKPAYSGQVVGINGFCAGNGCNAGGLSSVTINGQGGSQQGVSGVGISQDGQDTQDPGAPGAATPVNPNPEMISEVKVLTSNFSAENAKGPIVVNTVTKNGTSVFHGEGYLFARNSVLNANDAFNKEVGIGVPRPNESYYYPGGNIGGPLFIPGTGFNRSHQKLFFFEGYENYHQRLDGGVDRAFIPTQDMLNGDFSALNSLPAGTVGRPRLQTVPTTPNPANWGGMAEGTRPGCVITAGVMNSDCIDPIAQKYFQAVVPSTGLVDPTTHDGFNYVQSFVAPQNSYQNVVRIDWNISENNKVYFTWSHQSETANMPTGLWVGASDWAVPTPTPIIGANKSDYVGVSFLRIFSPTLTNEARFGYTYIDFPNSPQDPKKLLKKDLGYPLNGVYGNPDIPALTSWNDSMPNFSAIGNDFHPNMIAVKGSPSVSDNLTKVIKSHTTKFGFFYEHTYNRQDNWGQYMGIFQYASWAGTPTGNEYADWLMGMGWGSYAETALPPPSEIAQNVTSFYAQDSWKLNRRITLQYGMRFDHYARPYDASGFGMAIFSPSAYTSALAANPSAMNPGVSWHAMDHSVPLSGGGSRMFFYSPRIGAAIDVFGNGRTVIRGGWGKYRAYNSVQSNAYTGPAGTSYGAVTFGCGNNDPKCYTLEDVDNNAVTPVAGQPILNGNSFGAVDPRNDEQPLVTNYSLTVDQQLVGKMRLELSYVGSHTDFMQSWVNTDSVPLGVMSDQAAIQAQYPTQCGGSNFSTTTCENLFRPFATYSQVNEAVTAGKAQYDSLQATLRRSVGRLTLQANYTFSKALGDGTQVANGGLTGALPDYGAHWLYGILPFDRAHVFSAAYVYRFPGTNLGSRLLKGLANGWELSGITQIESGSQITAVASAQGNGFLNFGLSDPLSPLQAVGTPDITLYPLLTCNPSVGVHHGQYANPNCFAQAPVGTLGTGSMPYMPGPLYWSTDLTVIKNIKITERQNLQFRFAAFDPLNHSLASFNTADNNLHLIYPNAGGGLTSNATDPNHACPGPQCQAFGYADYAFGHRVLELGMKYSF